MPQSTDPDVRRYDGQGESVPCSECLAFMLLRDYDTAQEFEPSGEDDISSQFLNGFWGLPVPGFLSDIFVNASTLKGRQKKLAQLRRDVLPAFPRSLVCPRCLHVLKRS